MLSSSSLGQNPFNPTSAQERKDLREDRMVRRGIDVLKKRHGAAGEEGESEEEDAIKPKGRGKETVVDVDMEDVAEDYGEAEAGVKGKNRQRKSKAAKKVSQGGHEQAQTLELMDRRVGIQISSRRSRTLPLTSTPQIRGTIPHRRLSPRLPPLSNLSLSPQHRL